METTLKRQEKFGMIGPAKTFLSLFQHLSFVALLCIITAGSTIAQEKIFDPAWDEVDSKATKIGEFEGGQLYKQNAVYIIVLNGTHYEMGRQYGQLLKEQMTWHLGELKKEFFVNTAGNNPVDKPAPLLSYDELTKKFMAGFYPTMPYEHKQMLKGAMETSGLSLEEVVFLECMLQAVIYSAGITGCTSAAVWGEASKDGRVYTGRCHDFGHSWRERLGKIGVVRITNPSNSDISVAALTRAGQLTSSIDLMNSKGLYIEFNNADNIRPSQLPTNMRATGNLAYSLLSEYQSVDELSVVMPTLVTNDALLMLAADPTKARYFELSPKLSVKTDPEFLNGQLTSRANHALHPVWNMDAESDPERAIAFSRVRRANMVKFLEDNPSTNDAASIRKFLSKSIIVDGKVSDGVSCIMEPAIKVEDWTSYQSVTIPADLMIYWRIPTHTPWVEIDLKKYFANN